MSAHAPMDVIIAGLGRAAAHQCLTLNGANAARAGKCLQWVEDDGQGNAILTVENASYPGLTHRRTVFFVQRRFFILVDEALGTAEGDLDLHFQLTPGPAVFDAATKTARTDFAVGGDGVAVRFTADGLARTVRRILPL